MGSSLHLGDKPGLDGAAHFAGTPTPEEITAQVEKLLASPAFQHSDSNRQLLIFLAERATTNPGQHVKEIELATKVFGLSLETFDPQMDSTVRVKVGRLRAKILDYYANYCADDEVVLEIPKGAYCLFGHYRQGVKPHRPSIPNALPSEELQVDCSANQPVLTSEPYKARWYWWAACILLGAALGSVGAFLYAHIARPDVPSHLEQFWSSFYEQGHPLIAVFSNPRLAGAIARGGLHYYQDDNDAESTEPINLGYAGAGDVHSIHILTQLFDLLRWDLNVESGALLSWETAEYANLIFIGRPEQNPALHELPRLHEFYFKYHAGIINAHPQPGEASSYNYSAPSDDYAVIAFVPGLHPQENTLILAGNTTWGSQSAAECMTTERCVADLLDKLRVKPGQKVPYFEALLKVEINNDVPVWNTIITVHHYPTDYTSWQAPSPDER